jgi:hypothetical protein
LGSIPEESAEGVIVKERLPTLVGCLTEKKALKPASSAAHSGISL